MTAVDWVIVLFTVLLAAYGYLQGFIVGALSLVGFAGGAFLGTRLAPLLLAHGDQSPYAPIFGLLGAILAGGVLASGFEGVGARVRSALRFPGLRAVDGLLGATLTACVALGVVWVVGAAALQSSTSPQLRQDIRSSSILAELDSLLPPSGPILDALARIDPLPAVHGPMANVAAPDPRLVRTRAVRAAARSVVRVFGTACGLGVEGSGWAAGPGLIVTNAHVVAGEQDTAVQVGGVGISHPAAVVAFDVHDDIAVLHVADLGLPTLALAPRTASGTAVGILGYPENGPYDAQPGRIGPTETVDTQNAYGTGHVQRTITSLRGLVRPGNSGGPLVDSAGAVVATVFAAVTDGSHPGGFAVPDGIVTRQLDRARTATAAVGTGHCSA